MVNEPNVVRFGRQDKHAFLVGGLRSLRSEYGLSVVAAAEALATSPQQIEQWEARGCGDIEERARARFEEHVRTHGNRVPSNLLVGTFPLSLAREVLDLSVKEIAEKFGFSANTWYKFENNQRLLDREKLGELERLVRAKFVSACNKADAGQ